MKVIYIVVWVYKNANFQISEPDLPNNSKNVLQCSRLQSLKVTKEMKKSKKNNWIKNVACKFWYF